MEHGYPDAAEVVSGGGRIYAKQYTPPRAGLVIQFPRKQEEGAMIRTATLAALAALLAAPAMGRLSRHHQATTDPWRGSTSHSVLRRDGQRRQMSGRQRVILLGRLAQNNR